MRGRAAPSRVLSGPHVTNLGRDRGFPDGLVAHHAATAAGGAGVVVTEVASVHPSDHPSRHTPLAARCADGWAALAAACRPHGTVVLAGLGHAGAQGSSAHHRGPLWAPSAVPDVVVGEVPVAMTAGQVAEVVDGFAAAAAGARAAGLDGVEIAAGQHALLRQFLSGLTNHRDDAYGADRALLLREVVAAVRDALGDDGVLGLRLTVDELAPWAGITPDAVPPVVAGLDGVDYVVPVRGSGMSVEATRPPGHTPPGFLAGTVAALRAAVPRVAWVLAGSVVDADDAAAALRDGVADLVEMTRAQLADPDLVALVRAGRRPRPCVLTNQACRVRDVRNPAVSCAANPHVAVAAPAGGGAVTVVGGGPAGLEAARVLAAAGVAVTLHERADALGGALRWAARLPGQERFARLVAWWADELARLGVDVRLGSAAVDPAGPTVWATGGTAPVAPLGPTAVAVLDGAAVPGPVVVHDPVGDAVGVGIAELLAARGTETALLTPDPVAGKLLADRGDLVGANVRLQRAGVTRLLAARPAARDGATLTVVDVDTGARRDVPAATVVDCSPRRPGPVPPGVVAAGDVIAPRTVHEAVLEGRRAAAAVTGVHP